MREFTGELGSPARYDADPCRFPSGRTENTGNGYARGFDLFWRDQKTIRGFDYWLIYSYVDTKRLFLQYITVATPTFVSNHNLSVITKRYVEKIRTSLNLTYAFTSGRPYYNPIRRPVFWPTGRPRFTSSVSRRAITPGLGATTKKRINAKRPVRDFSAKNPADRR